MGFHCKIEILAGFTKKRYIGGIVKKGGAWTVQILKGGMRKRENVFLGASWYPNAHYESQRNI